MKHMRSTAAAVLLVFGIMTAHAQSLGDYARANKNTKAAPAASTHHYDNDNLPRNQQLSVVGAAPAQTEPPQPADAKKPADTTQPADGTQPAADGSKTTGGAATTADGAAAPPPTKTDATAKESKDTRSEADDRKKAHDEIQKKVADQKEKVASLSRELDLSQREYKLRSAVYYADAGERLRNSAQWDKDDARYKQQIDDKQKALDAARNQLETLQETARKAGIRQKDEQ